jgi:hypothetical protein
MRRVLFRLSFAWILGMLPVMPQPALAQDASAGDDLNTTPSLCLDGMETVPIEDDLVPTEISVDGGCMVSETPISI